MARLAGKSAIVTGAGRGIGRATAELFAREGARVFATDTAGPAEGFADANISFTVVDAASEADWARLVSEVDHAAGAIDILVNNAGIGGSQLPIAEENVADWNHVIAVNLTGVFLGMRSVIPAMQRRRRGSIVNLSSMWGIAAVSAAAAYQAAKAGVRQLSKHAAVAHAADNIRVNSVHPGIIATPLVLEGQAAETNALIVAATPLGRMGEPIEIANGILFLARDDASFMTGAELVLDGGYLAQ